MSVEQVASDHLHNDHLLVEDFKKAFNPLMGHPPTADNKLMFLGLRLELALNAMQNIAAELVAGRLRKEDDVSSQ